MEELSDQQKQAITSLKKFVESGKALVALVGPAGSGKTTVIKALQQCIDDVVVSAMTNKAADVLRKKGIIRATTAHQAGLVPVYAEPGKTLASYLRSDASDVAKDEEILLDFFPLRALRKAWKIAQESGRDAATEYLGIDFYKQYSRGYEAKDDQEGVLIIDEASMLDGRILSMLQKSFAQIILVGDDFQLPPINEPGVFWQVKDKVYLSEVHRQSEASQSLKLAVAIRSGKDVRMAPVEPIRASLCKSRIPIVVWRNETRISLTKEIRKALRYKDSRPRVGEPIVSCVTKQLAGIKFTKNSIWQIIDKADDGKYLVGDGVEEKTNKPIGLFMEEYAEPAVPGLHCRYGYALTCHAAQGSEWKTVMIHAEDAEGYLDCNGDDGPKWLYTAATRAQESVLWVSNDIVVPKLFKRKT